jgi:hypothetical protein
MSAVAAIPYETSLAGTWNELNETANGGHFLFHRDFMEYHADRFTDASLILVRDHAPIALFPANRDGDTLHSHQGLTFGGIVHGDGVRVEQVLEMFDALVAHARRTAATSIVYKAMPSIYRRSPAEDSLYALFRHGAQCRRREASAAIDYRAPGRRSRRRERALRKSARPGLEFGWDEAWEEYWRVLADVLRRRHDRAPVHSAHEIRLLATRFPANIRLFTARRSEAIVAGVVMFETPYVAHAQYVAASPEGQALCALDGIIDRLIAFYESRKRYFDFGISTEQAGLQLNVGLAGYKREWGGGCVVQDTYQIEP